MHNRRWRSEFLRVNSENAKTFQQKIGTDFSDICNERALSTDHPKRSELKPKHKNSQSGANERGHRLAGFYPGGI
jgi:hypothetical protein